jgi:hypothetical protein
VPASDGGDDGVRVLGPTEALWLGIGLGDEAVDAFLERGQAVEYAALRALSCVLASTPTEDGTRMSLRRLLHNLASGPARSPILRKCAMKVFGDPGDEPDVYADHDRLTGFCQ